MHDRIELLPPVEADEARLGNSRISDWRSPHVFETGFCPMWGTTFALQPWHSAVELALPAPLHVRSPAD